MKMTQNPFRGTGMSHPALNDIPAPSDDASTVRALLGQCPHASETPLLMAQSLAQRANVAQVLIKDERQRMGLGSFKALGAAYVIAKDAQVGRAKGQTYVTASAGNHGLSVAVGAAAFGAKAVIYLAETVPEAFAARLRDIGADVIRAGAIYEESVAAAVAASAAGDGVLLSDSAYPGYIEPPYLIMEGYLALMAETTEQMETSPTHIFLQAGVGGLAAAAAVYARKVWGDAPHIIVVEPDAAPALISSITNSAPVTSTGPVSVMGRLDCKEPSLVALKGLARDADTFATISEAEAIAGTQTVADAGYPSTPSGAAGLACLLALDPAQRTALGITGASRILTILSEIAE